MDLRALFGLRPKDRKANENADLLHLWEDDYLMIELVPQENLEFIKSETRRIHEFGIEHYDGAGFTDITQIGEMPAKTIDRKIPFSHFDRIFSKTDLQRIEKVVMQGVGILEGDSAPTCYGSNKFAVILEAKSELLKNIWITGWTQTDTDRQRLKQGLTLESNSSL